MISYFTHQQNLRRDLLVISKTNKTMSLQLEFPAIFKVSSLKTYPAGAEYQSTDSLRKTAPTTAHVAKLI